MSEPDTRTSLLTRVRLRPFDEPAWSEFDRQYRRMIERFARRRGVPEAEASDIAQQVMLSLAEKLPEGSYERGRGRFRAWLFTIVSRRILDWRRRVLTRERTRHQLEVEDETGPEAPEAWDEAWSRFLVEAALDRLARTRRLDGISASILAELYLRGRSPEAIAALLGCGREKVHRTHFRWRQPLAEVVEGLRRELGDEAA